MDNATSWPLYTRKIYPVPTVGEAGWVPGAVNITPTGIRSPDRSAHTEVLYRLSFLADIIITTTTTTW